MKQIRNSLIIIFLIMAGLPWAAVTFAPADAGMAICFVLFFGVNPLCSLYVGIWSGLDAKHRWYLPLVNAAAFLVFAWALFAMDESAFAGYAIAYLAVGVLSMVVTIFVIRGIQREL